MNLNPELVRTLISSKSSNKKAKASKNDLNDVLDFSGSQIESLGTFSSYAQQFQSFKKWDLSQNYITKIPPDFADNSKLQEVTLSENVLDKMTGFDGNMYLKVLDLSQNQIANIEGLANLPELRVLVSFLLKHRTCRVIRLEEQKAWTCHFLKSCFLVIMRLIDCRTWIDLLV